MTTERYSGGGVSTQKVFIFAHMDNNDKKPDAAGTRKHSVYYKPKDPYDYGGIMWGLDEFEDVWDGDAGRMYDHEWD